MTKMDWDKEKKGSNVVFPEGTYKVRIDKQEPVTASTGTKQIRWFAKIVEPKEFEGQTIVIHTPLTEKSLWKLATLVSACGLVNLPVIDTESEMFNRICQACVGRTSYWRNVPKPDLNGNPRNEIVQFSTDADQELAEVSLTDPDTPEFEE